MVVIDFETLKNTPVVPTVMGITAQGKRINWIAQEQELNETGGIINTLAGIIRDDLNILKEAGEITVGINIDPVDYKVVGYALIVEGENETYAPVKFQAVDYMAAA